MRQPKLAGIALCLCLCFVPRRPHPLNRNVISLGYIPCHWEELIEKDKGMMFLLARQVIIMVLNIFMVGHTNTKCLYWESREGLEFDVIFSRFSS